MNSNTKRAAAKGNFRCGSFLFADFVRSLSFEKCSCGVSFVSGRLSENSDFTRGSIPKKLILFMLPVLGALALQAMYGAVDLLIVGCYGSTAGLSGVSTGSRILNLITFMVSGSAMSITVLISRYLGEKRDSELGSLIGVARDGLWHFDQYRVSLVLPKEVFDGKALLRQCYKRKGIPKFIRDSFFSWGRCCCLRVSHKVSGTLNPIQMQKRFISASWFLPL